MEEIDEILVRFNAFCTSENIGLTNQIRVETLLAGVNNHIPTPLLNGEMAVYIFLNEEHGCLKVGKVGRKSRSRFQYQHYNPSGAKSNLADSLLCDQEFNANINSTTVGQWIKQNTTRINLFLNSEEKTSTLNFLESFMQALLKPKYEGHRNQG